MVDFLLLIGCLHVLPVDIIWDDEFEQTMDAKSNLMHGLNYGEFQVTLSKLLIKDFNQCSQKYMTIIKRRNMKYGIEKWKIKLDNRIFQAPEAQGIEFKCGLEDELSLSSEPPHTPDNAKLSFGARQSILRRIGKYALVEQNQKLRRMNLPPFCETTSASSSSSSSEHQGGN
jgi:hypothetical protein